MKMLWIGLGVLLLGGLVTLIGCVNVRLPDVPTRLSGEPASPPVLGPFAGDPEPVISREAWAERRAPMLRESFSAEVYGRFPAAQTVTVEARESLAVPFRSASAVEQWRVRLSGGAGFSLLVVLPSGKGPSPILITQNFCGNAAVYPKLAGIAVPQNAPRECGSGWARPLIEAIFGDAIITPPTEAILQRGYGLAMVYAAEVVPDRSSEAEAALLALTPAGTPPEQRTGAIAAWAWVYLRALDALAGDARIAADRVALWGHSRNGKSALLAAAMDPRPAAVIALQPGTGGGSLGRDKVGESIAQITSSYPHWFSPAYAAHGPQQADLPVDQHQLLALIAPRPILLAGARRDQWSDPHGAVRAAIGASPVYELFGFPAFQQPVLKAPEFGHPLVTYMRGGLHGVHKSDWMKALDFLDARLAPPDIDP